MRLGAFLARLIRATRRTAHIRTVRDVVVPQRYCSRISEDGVQALKQHEGLRTQAYRDTVGVLTIGYGTSAPMYTKLTRETLTEDTVISEEKAITLLHGYFHTTGTYRKLYRVVPLQYQRQYDAVCSWLYNVGGKALTTMHDPKYLNTPLLPFRTSLYRKKYYTVATTPYMLLKHQDWYALGCAMSAWRSPKEIRSRRIKEIEQVVTLS